MQSRRKVLAAAAMGVLAAAGVLGTASTASAVADQTYAYEPFNYAPGSSVTNTSATDNGSFGFTTPYYSSLGIDDGTPRTTTSSPLTSPVADGTAGGVALSVNNTTGGTALSSFSKNFTAAVQSQLPSDSSPGQVFFSFLIQPDLSGTGTRIANMQVTDSGSNVEYNFGYNLNKSSSFFGWNLNAPGETFTVGSTGPTFSAGSTSLIVVEFNYAGAGSDSVTEWTNPTSTSSTAGQTASGLTLSPLTGINPGISGPIDPLFDEVRLGNDFASVTTDVTPEPATLGLLGVIGMGGLLRRRRNRRFPIPS